MKYVSKRDLEVKKHDADWNEARERGLQDIYRAYPTIPRSTANDSAILELTSEYWGHDTLGFPAPDLLTFRSIVEADPQILKGQHQIYIEPVERQKIKVIDEIEELLTGIMSPLDIKTEIGKLKYQGLDAAKARKTQIEERQRLSKLSVPAIRKEIVEARPKPHKYMPYDLLPPPSELPAADLVRMLKTGDARKIVRKHGSDQINDRIFNRS
jgi:hypothetical protein